VGNIDIDKINKIITSAFDETIEALSEAYDDAITHRKNGEVVGTPRNIIDTEELIDSKIIIRQGNSAFFEWEAEHAAIVHDGATLQTGSDIPARPWTELAAERFDASEFMSKKLNKSL
jgi:hypothetical protein